MTVDEVVAQVEAIRAAAHDDEAAHVMEDNLYRSVLHSISLNPWNAQELAEAAFRATFIDFERWYA